jgi:hypothetical protein
LLTQTGEVLFICWQYSEKKHDWTKNWNNISQQVVLTMIS